MSSNLDNHKSSVRDIAKLFAEEKRLGTKAADLVNGTALTKCLEINEAFEVRSSPQYSQSQLKIKIARRTKLYSNITQMARKN